MHTSSNDSLINFTLPLVRSPFLFACLFVQIKVIHIPVETWIPIYYFGQWYLFWAFWSRCEQILRKPRFFSLSLALSLHDGHPHINDHVPCTSVIGTLTEGFSHKHTHIRTLTYFHSILPQLFTSVWLLSIIKLDRLFCWRSLLSQARTNMLSFASYTKNLRISLFSVFLVLFSFVLPFFLRQSYSC